MKFKYASMTALVITILCAALMLTLSACKKDDGPDNSLAPQESENVDPSADVSGDPNASAEVSDPVEDVTNPVLPDNPPAYMEDVTERIGTLYLNRPAYFYLIKQNLTNPLPVESGAEPTEIPTPEEFYKTVISDYNEQLGYAFFDVNSIEEVPYGIKVMTLSYANKETGETEGPLQVWFECPPDDVTATRIAIVYAGADGVYSYPGIQDSPEPEAYLDDNVAFLEFEASGGGHED